MRAMTAITLVLVYLAGAHGQAGDKGKNVKRFGIVLDAKKYPQATPKETLDSVVKAISDNRVDYMLAHLADPDFVDRRVELYEKDLDASQKGEARKLVAFDRLVKETTEKFLEDPSKLKDLKRFQEKGTWEEQEKTAVASLENLKARRVFMKRLVDERWTLENREK